MSDAGECPVYAAIRYPLFGSCKKCIMDIATTFLFENTCGLVIRYSLYIQKPLRWRTLLLVLRSCADEYDVPTDDDHHHRRLSKLSQTVTLLT
jgi:hypothetical protein